jgi:hypothetical protein
MGHTVLPPPSALSSNLGELRPFLCHFHLNPELTVRNFAATAETQYYQQHSQLPSLSNFGNINNQGHYQMHTLPAVQGQAAATTGHIPVSKRVFFTEQFCQHYIVISYCVWAQLTTFF